LIGASQSMKGIAMRLILSLFCAAALFSPSIASAAADKAPLPSEVRLSDAEKEKILEQAAANAREPASSRIEIATDDDLPPPIHGEVGFTIGTGGYRSAYGTAIVPLKNDGVAIISLGTTDFGSRARYPTPWGW